MSCTLKRCTSHSPEHCSNASHLMVDRLNTLVCIPNFDLKKVFILTSVSHMIGTNDLISIHIWVKMSLDFHKSILVMVCICLAQGMTLLEGVRVGVALLE